MNGLYLLAAFGTIAVIRTLVVGVAWCLRDAGARHATRTQVGRLYWSPTLILMCPAWPDAEPHFPPAAGAARRDGHTQRSPLDGFVTEVA